MATTPQRPEGLGTHARREGRGGLRQAQVAGVLCPGEVPSFLRGLILSHSSPSSPQVLTWPQGSPGSSLFGFTPPALEAAWTSARPPAERCPRLQPKLPAGTHPARHLRGHVRLGGCSSAFG